MALAHHPMPRRSRASLETSSPLSNPDLWRLYQAIVNDSRYGHFRRIPKRMVRFLESFHIDFDRVTVHERLLSHYLFIAVVDDAIDSGEEDVAPAVFDFFRDATCGSNEISCASDVAIVTEILKSHVADDNRVAILRSLRRAHREVIHERKATSIGRYIKHRKALGRATAKQSYFLIRSALREPNQKLCRLMEEIGAVGCLVDSMIDIDEDHRSGLLNFDLTAVGYATLCLSTAVAGLRVLAKRPALVFLLAEAVLDNIKDRGRARAAAIPQGESLRQHSAQSFRDSVVHPL
jgi:hypothetical protein